MKGAAASGRKRVRAAIVAAPLLLTLLLSTLFLGSLVGASPAQAHDSLLAGSPGPGQTVGGTITTIDLVFSGNFVDHGATFETPEGEVSEPDTEKLGDNWLRLLVPELEVEGQYIVRYSFTSSDSDPISSAFAFSYDAAAPAPIAISAASAPGVEDEGQGLLFWVVGGGLLTMVGLLATRLALRLSRLAKSDAPEGSELNGREIEGSEVREAAGSEVRDVGATS